MRAFFFSGARDIRTWWRSGRISGHFHGIRHDTKPGGPGCAGRGPQAADFARFRAGSAPRVAPAATDRGQIPAPELATSPTAELRILYQGADRRFFAAGGRRGLPLGCGFRPGPRLGETGLSLAVGAIFLPVGGFRVTREPRSVLSTKQVNQRAFGFDFEGLSYRCKDLRPERLQ